MYVKFQVLVIAILRVFLNFNVFFLLTKKGHIQKNFLRGFLLFIKKKKKKKKTILEGLGSFGCEYDF